MTSQITWSIESLFTLQHSAQWRDVTLTPQPIRCQLQLPSMTSDVVLSLRQAHEKLREEIRTALSVLLRENSTVAITIFCIFCFETVARGLVCLDDVSNNRFKNSHTPANALDKSHILFFLGSATCLHKYHSVNPR